ncbi:MAG: heavy metal transporter [Clostridia bacterium BRH_c25]|nr:MAG: heavy metal transporter [Clostridia bacterium BRH_c25]
MNMIKKELMIEGMTCSSCELRIENTLKKLEGVAEVKVEYSSSKAFFAYDSDVIKLQDIIAAVDKAGYKAFENKKNIGTDEAEKSKSGKSKEDINQLVGIGIILLALYVIIKNTVGFNFIPEVNQSMGYGILFVVGLLTSLHCIAMCGGINLSQCVAYKHSDSSRTGNLKPSFLYNAGRVVSYTVIGGIVGGIGSVVSFSGGAKGIVAIVAGLFMVIMGINMLNIFPWLKKLNPRMPKIFGNKIYNNNGKNGPFYVGLLNGLMPCGPLQAMQLYALGTGSIAAGALSMFLFSIGTVPLMFGFGAISSMLGKKFTGKLMKVSAVLVMTLGFIMMSRGLVLSGVNASVGGSSVKGNVAVVENGVQVVAIDLKPNSYAPIIVQKGIPVKFIINAENQNINGCNNAIIIPKYNIQKALEPGKNIIEFTPEEAGTIPYSCWMGMIGSSIKVVDELSQVTSEDIGDANSGAVSSSGGSCCSGSALATEFANGNIPTDDIKVAEVKDGVQEVTINVNDYGYSPAVVVLQKGVKAKIKFNPEQLNSCNNVIVFPDYGGQLDLSAGELETPALDITEDFTFQCWMGMLNGYVKVVDDVNNIDMEAIRKDVESFVPPAGSGGCCG